MATHGKRRAFGQHFLKDTSVSNLIAQTALEEAQRLGCKTLLEIGPGRGALTQPLLTDLAKAGHGIEQFTLCERDEALADLWVDLEKHRDKNISSFRLTIEEGDFMQLATEKWLTRPPVAVVSNLPYSAGTAIFTLLAGLPESIPVMVLMFQAEVAQRLRAEVGTREWGRLSVWTQNRWDVHKLIAVPRKAFSPPPDVESEVVVITRRENARIPATLNGHQAELWEPLLKTCFTHRRKMLR
ncbi:MAG: ribosomal RNA small subunit methyltransferase A, partial [Bdellovibrionales bacterium GWC1_52_8]